MQSTLHACIFLLQNRRIVTRNVHESEGSSNLLRNLYNKATPGDGKPIT